MCTQDNDDGNATNNKVLENIDTVQTTLDISKEEQRTHNIVDFLVISKKE